jgi:putative Mg2+ transporter-C (MgtC) family protein
MPTDITWQDIAFRLLLTVLAGLVLGYNRSEQGKAAGMRTTLLVCLAASVAMIQVNLFLPMAGKTSDSFITNDLMRFPLGILTGVGFIGGGVILRRDDIVVGVTTAATLWLTTVIGLCLGGGQIVLGITATLLGLAALWLLKLVEARLRREQHAHVSVTFDSSGRTEKEIRRQLVAAGLSIVESSAEIEISAPVKKIDMDVKRLCLPAESGVPMAIESISQIQGVLRVNWKE